jgi:hypothetical protein
MLLKLDLPIVIVWALSPNDMNDNDNVNANVFNVNDDRLNDNNVNNTGGVRPSIFSLFILAIS